MRKRQSTITEEYAPSFRRRVNNNYLQLSLPNAKMILEQERESPKKKVTVDYESMLTRANQYFEVFVENYKKMNGIIDVVDDFIRKRMEAHEESLLSVVRAEIDKMQEECRRVVEEYNEMMDSKNKETEIYNLKNELDYFRSEALKLFEMNKSLSHDNKSLNELVKTKDSIIEELNEALKKTTKKYLKEKALGLSKDKSNIFERTSIKIEEEKPASMNKTTKNGYCHSRNNSENFDISKHNVDYQESFRLRYKNNKSISTNIGNQSFHKRFYTDLSTQEENLALSMKTRTQAKTKSTWKFSDKE